MLCFVGTIPFGPINMTVLKTTLDSNQRHGVEVAVAAALIEIIQALIAVSFGVMISDFLDTNNLVKIFLGAFFILLAAGIFVRKPDSVPARSLVAGHSYFLKGLLLAALNPQAIPFWIFALAAVSQYMVLIYSGGHLVAFLVGVFVGKLVALLGFVYTANCLRAHSSQSGRIVNLFLGAILLCIGLSQLWSVF